jgi:SAM-dependent methyltransferase
MSGYERMISMDYDDLKRMISHRIEQALHSTKPRVLEAGGGSSTHVTLNRPTHTVVLDNSPEQLARNSYASETILGDLQDPKAFKGSYDLIVCWDVLEHLERPRAAVENMIASLNDRGLLLIACPNLYSIKGLLTRFTPHWFHVWFYRNIRGDKLAGGPGRAPFPTYLRREMALPAVLGYAKANKLQALVALAYPGPAVQELKRKASWLYALYRLPAAVLYAVTFGRLDFSNTDYIVLLRRPGAQEAPQAA